MTARHQAARLGDQGMVGRHAELAELLAAVPADGSSAGSMRCIEGPPGIGKTRLVHEAVALAEQAGARVVWTRCWDGESGPAYWPWRQVVGALASEGSGSTELGPFDEVAETGDRSAVFAVVRELLHDAVGGRPTVLVLDDLHWADAASLLLLGDLGGDVPRLPLLVLATSRGRAAVSSEVADVYEGALASGAGLALSQLTRDETRTLVAGLVRDLEVSDALVERIVESSDGNPFHAQEVVRLLRGRDDTIDPHLTLPVPDDLAGAVLGRIELLPDDLGEVLTWAAVSGRELDLALLSHICEVDRIGLLQRLDPAFDVELLVVDGGSILFAHDAVRDAICGALRTSERMTCHATVARALVDVHGDAVVPATLAHHWSVARPLGYAAEAFDSSCRAAAAAARVLAYEEQVLHLRRALDALGDLGTTAVDGARERASLLLRLGTAEANAGWTDVAVESLRGAADVARAMDDVLLLADIALAVPPDFEAVDNAPLTHPLQVALLEEAADLLPAAQSAGARVREARVLAKLAVARYWGGGDAADRIDASARALRVARAAGDPATLAWCLDARAYACWDQAHTVEREEATTELHRLVGDATPSGRAAFDDDIVLDARRWLILQLLERGQLAAAQREVTWYERRARRLKRPVHLWMVAKWRAALAFAGGRLDEAEELAIQAADIGAHATDPQVALDSALVLIGILREQQGRTQEVAEWVASVADGMPEVPGWRCGLAATFAMAGRHDAAAVELDALAANDFAAIPRDLNWMPALVLLTRVVEALGDEPRARALRAELLPARGLLAVQAFGNVVYGPVARHLGILDTVLGDPGGAIEWYRQARELVGAWSPNHWALSALGGGRLLLGCADDERRAEGERLVRDASAIFHRLGMPGYASEADAALVDATGRHQVASGRDPVVSPADDPNLLRRDGDQWRARFRGGPLLALAPMKGLPALAALLARPHHELHVLELAAAIEGTPVVATTTTSPLIDEEARQAYLQRVRGLESELEDADASGNAAASARAQAELDALLIELNRATGLGGHIRRETDASERARVNVTKLLRRSVDRLGELDAALGAHLRASLHTGTHCCYAPDPQAQVDWTT